MTALRPQRRTSATIDILFCLADHFEPDFRAASVAQQTERVRRWVAEYPRLVADYRDADGYSPRHTFFYPIEAYRREEVDLLAGLCGSGHAELEMHLHHGYDTADTLTDRLNHFKGILGTQHGLLSRTRSGEIVYGFIHGNWALDNGALEDELCGVNSEMTVLIKTGCYADFTMPAVPSPAQSRLVNRIYYAIDDPQQPRSYDRGWPVKVGGMAPPGALLLVQGPLMLNWRQSVFGVLPRIENGAIDGSPGHHPHAQRLRQWVRAGICVEGRPNWVFVKVYTHGAPERNADLLLGAPMAQFHQALGEQFNDGVRYRIHYVTAREVYNIIKAAEAGLDGNPGDFRDYALLPAGRAC